MFQTMNTKIFNRLEQICHVGCHIWKWLVLIKWLSHKYTMLFHDLFLYYHKYDRK